MNHLDTACIVNAEKSTLVMPDRGQFLTTAPAVEPPPTTDPAPTTDPTPIPAIPDTPSPFTPSTEPIPDARPCPIDPNREYTTCRLL